MIEQWLADPTISRIVRLAVMVAAALVTVRLTTLIVRRVSHSIRQDGELGPTEGEKRLKTFGSIVRYAVIAVVCALLVAAVLTEFGVAVGPFLGTLGIASIVVGLGAQNLVRDYIAGFFLLIENHYAVDDWVRLAGVDGRVERITLRMTRLRDLDGNTHVIPNGAITVATNVTKEWTRVVVDVGVAYKEDIDHVVEVLQGVGRELEAEPEWSESLLEPLSVKAIQDFRDSSVTVRLVYRVTPEQQWDLRREVQRRVKVHFDREGIEIPFPHRTLYVGQGESGTLGVRVDRSGGSD